MISAPSRRGVALAALLGSALAVGLGPPPAAAEPGYFRIATEAEAPFSVRWLDAGEDEVVVSDLAGGVAALRLDSGLAAWSRSVAPPGADADAPSVVGPPMGVAVEGDLVLVTSHELAAYRRSVGTRVWERGLRCGGGALCRERVVHVDASGVYLAGGGEVQHALLRLDLETGAPVWREAAEVHHPQRVLANADVLAVIESLPPFGVRFIAKDSGRERGHWARRVAGVPRPATDHWLTRSGLAAVDLRPEDGHLAHVVTTDASGREAASLRVPRSAGVKRAAVFARVDQHRFVAFTPDPAAGTGQLVLRDLIGDAPPIELMVASSRAPLEIGGALVFHRRVGEVVGLEAIDPMTGRRIWERDLGGFSTLLGEVAVHAVGVPPETGRSPLAPRGPDEARGEGWVVVVGQGDPVVMWALEPATGAVVGYRALALGGAAVTAIDDEPGGLVAAAGARVLRLVLEPVARAEAAFEEHLATGSADDARSLARALAPLAPHAPSVRRLLERGARARLAPAEARFAAGDLAGALAAVGAAIDEVLAGEGEGAGGMVSREVAHGFVSLLGPVARLVADEVIGARRPPGRAARDALVGLGARVVRGLARVHSALEAGGALATSQDRVASAVIVLTLALDRVGEPLSAADLVETLFAAGYREVPELEGVYAAVAYRAFALVHRDLARPLASGRADQRAEVARSLEHFRHGHPVFGDAAYLSRAAATLSDDDARHAAAAAREVSRALRGRLAELRGAYGEGYPEASCALACASLAAVCDDGCRSEAACEAAGTRCRADCAVRRGVPRWVPAPASGPACGI